MKRCSLQQFIIATPLLISLPLRSTDTPEEYWCQVPELQNLTTAVERKFLSIPLIEVRLLLLAFCNGEFTVLAKQYCFRGMN